MARPDKAAAVAELKDHFQSSDGAVLTDYRGLTVKQLRDLRRALGENVDYAVTKNTLTKIAAREAGVDVVDDLLVGPTAIAFIRGDVVEAAKSLRDFAKDNDSLVIKGGYLDGRSVGTDEIKKMADLESREVLLAKLAGGLKAGIQNAAALFNAPLTNAARTIAALEAKAQQDPSVLAGGAGTPAPAAEQEAPSKAPADEATEG